MTSVAIVHDYLTQRGGAERVVLAIARAYPDAAVYTSLFDPGSTFPEFADLDVRPSMLDHIALFRHHHRLVLPLLAPTFSSMRVDAEVAICSSSGWAHGARVTGRRVVYCHTPARWLYQPDRYTAGRKPSSLAVRVLGPPLRRWDRAAAARADRYLVNSTVVARAVADAYGIDAEVLAPPVTVAVDGPTEVVPGVEPDAVLCVSRLLAYKNIDAVVDAFALLPGERLVVVGDGPDRDRIRAALPPNVQLVGAVTDPQLRWLYRQSCGLVAAAYEDFGLTPLEAAAFGRPAAVLRAGGYLDTVVEGDTGVMFAAPVPSAIADGVTRMRAREWDATLLRDHAAGFSEDRFAGRLRDVVDEVLRS